MYCITEGPLLFQVKWSDSSSSCVTKTHVELENFLFKVITVADVIGVNFRCGMGTRLSLIYRMFCM